MPAITAQMVSELRARTSAPLMDSKRALVDADGDMNKAIELLRERGSASADKKLANEMKEGMVSSRIAPDGKIGVLLRLGCQTDFVARNDGFQKLLSDLTDLAFEHEIATPADLMALKYGNGTVESTIKELIGGTIKENIGITGLARFQTDNGRIEKYVHHNAKVGALIQIDGSNAESVKTLGAEIAMHVSAGVPQVPVAVNRDGIPADLIAAEKAAASDGTAGKPPQIVEKIVAGKLEKYFQDVCLVDQPFIKDDKKRIRDLVAETGKAAGATLNVVKFAYFKVGEA
jgi:elongation factor Ts